MHDSLYWLNMNADTEDAVKNCSSCMGFSKHSPGQDYTT